MNDRGRGGGGRLRPVARTLRMAEIAGRRKNCEKMVEGKRTELPDGASETRQIARIGGCESDAMEEEGK